MHLKVLTLLFTKKCAFFDKIYIMLLKIMILHCYVVYLQFKIRYWVLKSWEKRQLIGL